MILFVYEIHDFNFQKIFLKNLVFTVFTLLSIHSVHLNLFITIIDNSIFKQRIIIFIFILIIFVLTIT
jgi:hypothetical protein